MGLLDKLWDDVVAGPLPEHGLGRLRRRGSLNGAEINPVLGKDENWIRERRQSGEFQVQQEEALRMVMEDTKNQKNSDTNPSGGIKKPPMLALLRTNSDVTASTSTPTTPTSSSTPTPTSGRERENVWRSVFNPGSNKAMDKVGSNKFDKAQPNSPTVYDWLYSGDTKSSWR